MIRSLLSKLLGAPSTDASDEEDSAVESDGTSAESDDSAPNADGDADAVESNSVWDLIPSWQYDGRHVESGGVTRDEQERALRDIQRQAAEIERSENQQPDPES